MERLREDRFIQALFSHGLTAYEHPKRYVVLMDGPRADGCVVEIENGDL